MIQKEKEEDFWWKSSVRCEEHTIKFQLESSSCSHLSFFIVYIHAFTSPFSCCDIHLSCLMKAPTGHEDKKRKKNNLFATFPVMMIKNYLVRTMGFYAYVWMFWKQMKNTFLNPQTMGKIFLHKKVKFMLEKISRRNVVFVWNTQTHKSEVYVQFNFKINKELKVDKEEFFIQQTKKWQNGKLIKIFI